MATVNETAVTAIVFDASGAEQGAAAVERAGRRIIDTNEAVVTATERVQRPFTNLERRLAGLERRIDPVAAAQAKLRQGMDLLDAGYAKGLRTLDQYNRGVEMLERSYGSLSYSFRSLQENIDRSNGLIAANGNALRDRAEDIAAYGTEMDRLRAKYSPLFALQQRYRDQLNEIRTAQRAGALSTAEAAAAINNTKTSFASQVRALHDASDATQRHTGVMRLQGHQMANLTYQINDVVSGLAMGQPPLMILTQQGGQFVQIFGGVRNTLSAIASVLTPFRVGMAAVAATIGLVGARAIDLAGEARENSVALRAMGLQAEMTASQLHNLIEIQRDLGVSRADARAAITAGVRVPGARPGDIENAAGLAPDFAAAYGISVGDATKSLVEMGVKGYSAIKALDDAYSFLNPTAAEQIRLLADQGNQAEAVAVAYEALRDRVNGAARDMQSEAGKAFSDLKDEVSDLITRVAQSDFAQFILNWNTGIVRLLRSGSPFRDQTIPEYLGLSVRPSAPMADDIDSDVSRGLPRRSATGESRAAAIKYVDEQTKAYEREREALFAASNIRDLVRAGLEAEIEARDKNIEGQAREELISLRVAQARDRQAQAANDNLSAIRLETAGALDVAEAYRISNAAGAEMEARTRAISEASRNSAVDVDALTAAIREQTAAQALVGATQMASDAQFAADNQRQLTEAAREGAAASAEAARQIDVEAHRRKLLATATDATRMAVLAEVAAYDVATKARLESIRIAESEAALRSSQDDLNLAERELQLVGATSRERTKQLALLQKEIDLRRRGIDLASEQAQKELEITGQISDRRYETERLNAASQEIQGMFTTAFDRIGEAITQAFATGERSAIKFGDINRAMLSELAQGFLRLGLFNPLKNAIFGSDLTTLGGLPGGSAGAAGGGLSNLLSLGKLFSGGGLANIGSNWAAGGLSGVLLGVPATATALGGGATAASLGVSAVAGGATNAGIVTSGATSGLFGSAGAMGALGYAGLAIGAVMLASQLFKKKPSDFTASFQGMLGEDFVRSEDKANSETRQLRDQIMTGWEASLSAVLGGLGLKTPGNTYMDFAAGSRDGLRFWQYDTATSYAGLPASARSDPIASGRYDTVEELIAGALEAVIARAGTEGLTTALRAVAENADFSDLEEALADIELAKVYDQLGQTVKATAEADAAIAEINARFDELTDFAERFGLVVDKVDTGRADAFADLASGFTEGLRDEILALTDPAQLAVRELEAWRDAQIRNANAIAVANGMAGASTEDLALIAEAFGLKLEQIGAGVGEALDYITAAQAQGFNEQLRAVEAYLSEVERNNATWKRLSDQLRQTRQGLLLDTNLSALSPMDRLTEARSQFNALASRAALGDQEAIAELPELSRQYLEASRAYYASSEDYFADFNRVQQVLADTEALAGRHLSIGDQQLAAARDQVAQLNALINGDSLIVSSIDQTNAILAEIKGALVAAGVPGAGGSGVGTGALGTGISYVDTGYVRSADDVINGLTRTELDRVRASLGITTAGGGLLRAQIAEDPAFAQRYRDAIIAAGGVPGFADGGWHTGGWRITGERGPELAYTPPQRIFNATDTQRMLSGAGLGGGANDNRAVVSAIRDGNRMAASNAAAMATQIAEMSQKIEKLTQELGDLRATQPKRGYGT
ncbi:phage tail length tape measure family protein [Oceanibaculum indicum]|uniref:Tail length tape measure protein n=1 Tax=Oceanibaculum indicum TaxID=526216 RepID=A0A420WGP8_9PROT|nr:phage tail length tape measure family protein [Oceanibaculum indicum]RKQ70115.1 tail length tape measure protein [Oceanibaculum indicum]